MIGEAADTPEQQAMAWQLFYTWREFFVKHMRDVQPTDLLYHMIDLKPRVNPIKAKVP